MGRNVEGLGDAYVALVNFAQDIAAMIIEHPKMRYNFPKVEQYEKYPK